MFFLFIIKMRGSLALIIKRVCKYRHLRDPMQTSRSFWSKSICTGTFLHLQPVSASLSAHEGTLCHDIFTVLLDRPVSGRNHVNGVCGGKRRSCVTKHPGSLKGCENCEKKLNRVVGLCVLPDLSTVCVSISHI